MLQFFQNLEQTAGQYKAVYLIGPGLVCVLLGLFVWLGGLEFRKIVVPVMGAIAGGICGYYLSSRNIVLSIVCTGSGAVVAVVLEKIFITLLSTILIAAIALAILIGPEGKEAISFKQVLTGLQIHSWVIIAALPILVIIAALLLWRLTSALCFATVGTFLIFVGMVLLLLYKDAMPISAIVNKRIFYLAVITAMIAFGTAEQFLLCRFTHSRNIAENKSEKEK